MREKLFMTRLKRMLEMSTVEDVELHCPIEIGYRIDQEQEHICKKLSYLNEEECDYCMNLVGAKTYCPCRALGEEEAYKKAWAAVNEYEEETGLLL